MLLPIAARNNVNFGIIRQVIFQEDGKPANTSNYECIAKGAENILSNLTDRPDGSDDRIRESMANKEEGLDDYVIPDKVDTNNIEEVRPRWDNPPTAKILLGKPFPMIVTGYDDVANCCRILKDRKNKTFEKSANYELSMFLKEKFKGDKVVVINAAKNELKIKAPSKIKNITVREMTEEENRNNNISNVKTAFVGLLRSLR